MTTRSLLPGLGLALLAGGLAAQGDDFQAKYDKKISEDWVKSSPWVMDYDEARAKAKETGKPIFAYFTRSYAP